VGIPLPRASCWLLVAWAMTGVACKQAAPTSETAVQRGRALYLEGRGSSAQELLAEVGAGVTVPAKALPCVNCHGRDGRGRPEGSVRPPNLRWESLTRPYEVVEGSGRRRPPYDERSFNRAVTLGVDAAGNRLSEVMPRYRLSRQELDDLIAYLQELSREADVGVLPEELRLGMVLPAEGPLAEGGRAARQALSAWLERVNQQGGLYGRGLSLHVVELPAEAGAREAALRAFLQREQIFALVGGFWEGEGLPRAALLEELQVPLVGALPVLPGTPPESGRYAFFLYSGLIEQGRVLVAHAVRQPPGVRRLAILHGASEPLRQAARRVADRCSQEGIAEVQILELSQESSAAGLATSLAQSGAQAALLLGGVDRLPGLLEHAARLGEVRLLLVPGVTGMAVPPSPAGRAVRLLTTAPVLPDDATPGALEHYRGLAEEYRLPAGHVAAQRSSLAAAMVLVEALRRAGREVTRETLVDTLEGLYQFQTGLMPPISYGRNRRVGAQGAHVLRAEAPHGQWVPDGSWSPLE
jgi:ABC-type branched-subunit amino acid transport system substrate-binding protein